MSLQIKILKPHPDYTHPNSDRERIKLTQARYRHKKNPKRRVSDDMIHDTVTKLLGPAICEQLIAEAHSLIKLGLAHELREQV